jgi:hypothetical protein
LVCAYVHEVRNYDANRGNLFIPLFFKETTANVPSSIFHFLQLVTPSPGAIDQKLCKYAFAYYLSSRRLNSDTVALTRGGLLYNLLWASIGNIIAGAGFMAAGYWTMSRPTQAAAPALTPAHAPAAAE